MKKCKFCNKKVENLYIEKQLGTCTYCLECPICSTNFMYIFYTTIFDGADKVSKNNGLVCSGCKTEWDCEADFVNEIFVKFPAVAM